MAGNDIAEQIQESFLSCTICFQPFNRPKALPCLHTFCEGCLRDYVASRFEGTGQFPCPLCRQVSERYHIAVSWEKGGLNNGTIHPPNHSSPPHPPTHLPAANIPVFCSLKNSNSPSKIFWFHILIDVFQVAGKQSGPFIEQSDLGPIFF